MNIKKIIIAAASLFFARTATSEIIYDELTGNHHFNGDVKVTGNIAPNSKVTILDGSLSVLGSVGSYVEIDLKPEKQKASSTVIMMNALNKNPAVHIAGNIEDHVDIRTVSATIEIEGGTGDYCTLTSISGSIITEHTGKKVALSSTSGNIAVGYFVGPENTLTSISGDIIAGGSQEGSSLKTESGDIAINMPRMNDGVAFKTTSGQIQSTSLEQIKRLVKKTKEKSHKTIFHQVSIQGGNFDDVVVFGGNVNIVYHR